MAETRHSHSTRRFPCEQCGALLLFAPGSHELQCDYCGHRTPIERRVDVIREYDFRDALERLARAGPAVARGESVASNKC